MTSSTWNHCMSWWWHGINVSGNAVSSFVVVGTVRGDQQKWLKIIKVHFNQTEEIVLVVGYNNTRHSTMKDLLLFCHLGYCCFILQSQDVRCWQQNCLVQSRELSFIAPTTVKVFPFMSPGVTRNYNQCFCTKAPETWMCICLINQKMFL